MLSGHTDMSKEQALDRIYNEIDKLWAPSTTSPISVALIERDRFFDYKIHNAGNKLSAVDEVVRAVLGRNAGTLLL